MAISKSILIPILPFNESTNSIKTRPKQSEVGGERFFSSASISSSSSNPRNLGFLRKGETMMIVDRFKSLLRDREEKLRICDEEDDVKEVYEIVLGELTFNSKSIITELTMIAEEMKGNAQGIAEAISERILEAPIDQKLPSLYLLDSIVKNVGFEYMKYFASCLPEVFCEAYKQVQHSQQCAMRHLFGTWSSVFPPSILQKIGNELQFSPYVNCQSSASASSESPSPQHTHGIHVDPKYLDTQKIEHETVVNEFHGARGMSSSLQSYGQEPHFGHDEHDIHQAEVISNQIGIQRGSPGIAVPAERLISSKAKPLRPASSSRDGSAESLSQSGDGFLIDNSPRRIVERASPAFLTSNSPRRIVERASPAQCGFQNGPVRVNRRDIERKRKYPSDNDRQHIGTSNVYHQSNGCKPLSPRSLIAAYGSHRTEDYSSENPLKIQRLDVNGIDSEGAPRSWQNTDEEEFTWENMSPTFADRGRKNDLRASKHPFRNRSPGTDPGKPAALLSKDGISTLGSSSGAMDENFEYGSGTGSEAARVRDSNYSQDPWYLQHGFPHSLGQHDLDASGKVNKTSSVPGKFPSAGQRVSSLMDNMEVPPSMAPTMAEKHLGKRPRSPPVGPHVWPPMNVHKSQPPQLSMPVLRHQKQIQGQFDLLDANKPLINQGPNDSSILPQQKFAVDESKALNSTKLPQMPQLRGRTSLDYQSQAQVAPLRPKCQEAQSVVPQIPAPILSHSGTQPSNHEYAIEGHGSVTYSFPLNKVPGVPSVHIRSMSDTPFQLHGGALPPRPPCPPQLPSQARPLSQNMGPTASHPSSQNMGPSSSEPPVGSALSSLISSLVAQGLISLTTPMPAQDSVGVEFHPDLLKVRHESVIKALYADLPRQCTTCGLRFKCQEEHRTHMDWHVTKNRTSKNRKQKQSRSWFVSIRMWLSSAEALESDAAPRFLPTETVFEKKDDDEMAVPADENQNTCALCGEIFDDFYSDETEEWMYRGAMYLNAPNGLTVGVDSSLLGPIVHAKCWSGSSVHSYGDVGLHEEGKD